MIRLLLVSLVISGTTLANSSLISPIKQLVDRSYLTSIHQMVAIGYQLYSGQLPSISSEIPLVGVAGRGNIFIFRDELEDGSRVFSKSFYHDNEGKLLTTIYSEGNFSQELVDVDSMVILNSNNIDQLSAVDLSSGSYRLRRQSDTLLRVADHAEDLEFVLGFERSKDYRIYRGQREIKNNTSIPTIVTETLTVNGYNPYVVFRHITWQLKDTRIWSEELSIGSYPFNSVSPFKIDATVIQSRKSLSGDNARPVGERISYSFEDNTVTDKTTVTTVELIKDSEIWIQFEGKITGGNENLSSLLIKHLRDRGETEVLEIASELDSELIRHAVILPW